MGLAAEGSEPYINYYNNILIVIECKKINLIISFPATQVSLMVQEAKAVAVASQRVFGDRRLLDYTHFWYLDYLINYFR